MSPEDKEHWEEMARQDKARYLKQKGEYVGPWKVPADMKKPKDPTAPKKPTPAYFSFSNERRQVVKKDNPTASNGEISKILSKMWKEADEGTRALYVEKEKEERKMYNHAVEEWKKVKKESGREHWWDRDTSTTDGNGVNKRARLDVLADAAPQHEAITSDRQRADATHGVGLTSMTPRGALNSSSGDGLSSAQSIHEQLLALSSNEGLRAIASFLPDTIGLQTPASRNNNDIGRLQGIQQDRLENYQNTNHHLWHGLQELLNRQDASPSAPGTFQSLAGGSNLSLDGLIGLRPALNNYPNNPLSSANQSGNLQSILALLTGEANTPQNQQAMRQDHSSALQGLNINDLLSILGSGWEQQLRQQQSHHQTQQSIEDYQALQMSLLQQGLMFGALPQVRSQPPETRMSAALNGTSALAALLGQQQALNTSSQDPNFQYSQQSRNDQLTQSLLQQSLLQQGVNRNQGPSNQSSLEEIISRLVRGNQQF